MHITYDKKSDCKYIAFQKRKRGIVARTEQLTDWLLVDYAKDGSLYGVEVLDASSHPGALMTVVDRVLYALAPTQSDARANITTTDKDQETLLGAFSDAVYA